MDLYSRRRRQIGPKAEELIRGFTAVAGARAVLLRAHDHLRAGHARHPPGEVARRRDAGGAVRPVGGDGPRPGDRRARARWPSSWSTAPRTRARRRSSPRATSSSGRSRDQGDSRALHPLGHGSGGVQRAARQPGRRHPRTAGAALTGSPTPRSTAPSASTPVEDVDALPDRAAARERRVGVRAARLGPLLHTRPARGGAVADRRRRAARRAPAQRGPGRRGVRAVRRVRHAPRRRTRRPRCAAC